MQHLTARLTADAAVKTFDSGKSVVNFNVVQNDGYKNKSGEWVDRSQYFSCSYWITPKVAQFLTKGRVVELFGKVSARAYQGSDGQPKAVLQLNTSKIIFHTAQNKANEANGTTATEKGTPLNDDLPF